MFKKILIANRGEIAVRIIRACREMGITSVAVFSEADRKSLHVQLADEAYLIGPAPSLESYLNQERILAVAKSCGAEAVHPGYGFLAENADFAARVREAGLTFIGPSPEAIRLMGDKTAARKLASRLGVPTIPGTLEPVAAPEEAEALAKDIGYPVLLKAAAGGGGKGMRLVRDEAEMASAFRAAQSEAHSAFGDGRVYLEKYIEEPRHIEFQILGDEHGQIIHLNERECSIQRRHQKLVEESPSVIMTPELRAEMGQAAVRLASEAGYSNAGTVEFLVDSSRNYYFLEMNTRLQVEHPVTEWITGLDLVKEQIRIAAGEPLRIQQDRVQARGHAIEVRVYAEDPASNFMPSTGKISFLQEPQGIGVRCDSGIFSGSEVLRYYDPLLAKLIVWAPTREEALDRLRRALHEYQIYGVETTLPFFVRLVDNPAFRAGKISTHFLERERLAGQLPQRDGHGEAGAVVSALHHFLQRRKMAVIQQNGFAASESKWKLIGRLESLR